jgi:hypothetical protein
VTCDRVIARAGDAAPIRWLVDRLPAGEGESLEAESDERVDAIAGSGEAGASSGPDEASRVDESVFSGDLGEFGLPELLEFLRVARRSGTLLCEGPEGVGALRLRKGNIARAASSRGESPAHRAATADSMKADLDEIRPTSREEVEQQAKAVVAELVGWTCGQFRFEPVVADDADDSRFEADAQCVLLEVLKQLDELSSGRERETQ